MDAEAAENASGYRGLSRTEAELYIESGWENGSERRRSAG